MMRKRHDELHTRICPDLSHGLKAYAARTRTTVRALVEAAVKQFLDGTSDLTIIIRRLDALARRMDRNTRDIRMLNEAFGVYVHTWYLYTPELPDEAKPSALRQADRRFEAFVRTASARLGPLRPSLDEARGDDLVQRNEAQQGALNESKAERRAPSSSEAEFIADSLVEFDE